jgi:hypothetical protein
MNGKIYRFYLLLIKLCLFRWWSSLSFISTWSFFWERSEILCSGNYFGFRTYAS